MRRHLLVPLTALALAVAACGGADDAVPDDTADQAVTSPDDDADTPDDDTAADPDDDAAPAAVTFVGTDEIAWESAQLAVAAGSVEVTVTCGDNAPHGIGIDSVQDGSPLAACDPGGGTSATVELEPGEYTFFCTVPGHRDAGMEGTLSVG